MERVIDLAAADIEALHLACAFDLKVPDRRRSEVQQLTSLINEQLWVGHFDLWLQDGMVMYRHALVLTGGVDATSQQCQSMLSSEFGDRIHVGRLPV